MIESRPYHFLLPVHVLAINKVKHEMMVLTGKLKKSPENPWLEDAFPIETVLF